MISRIEGQLVSVVGERANLKCGEFFTYEVLVPAADRQRLAARIDEIIEFRTLHYYEGQGQGSSFIPRLIGFTSDDDKTFFELFTTVKGMGNRKALRALALPFRSVAEAIAAKDLDTLKSLPEVGKRTAETIVVELHGKVDRFIELKPTAAGGPGLPADSAQSEVIRDAVAMLVLLGETNAHARHLVERATVVDPSIDTPEAAVAAAYRLKEPA